MVALLPAKRSGCKLFTAVDIAHPVLRLSIADDPEFVGGVPYYERRENILGELFYVEADFAGNCECCEYRQFVMDSSTYTIIDEESGNSTAPIPFPNSKYTAMIEDGSPDGPKAMYGHRSMPDENRHTDGYIGTDIYGRGRQGACSYYASDLPGLPNPQAFADKRGSTTKILVNVTFTGQVIDVCNGSRVVKIAKWTVTCAGTFKPT